jgi:hypothetical protein
MFDHLIYVDPDLDRATAEFTRLYGVSPSPGGRHAGFGTRNALLGLSASSYVEIVGIDPEQAVPAAQRLFALDEMSTPRFVSWCARASRPLTKTVAIAAAAGFDLGDVISMSRIRPDGGTLTWTMTSPFADHAGGVLPFYIDWGTAAHPAAALPAGLSLESLTAIHPDAGRIRAILDALGEQHVLVESGAAPALRAVLKSTPDAAARG